MHRSNSQSLALGLDFGTESVRALLVTLQGEEAGASAARYRRGQITERLPMTEERLPAEFALQDPDDWMSASARAIKQALKQAGANGKQDVISLGVDFTSCTMLPALGDGTPLCRLDALSGEKYAWPKLWKHHGAQSQTDKINALAGERGEPWLARYGGTVGLEWFFPKILETLEHAPQVYDATDVWIEGGDWYVWQLVGTDQPPPRSTCQAGYKAMWNAHEGYPSRDFFRALQPKMAGVVDEKMPGKLLPPGQRAGELCQTMARKLGLRAGLPVSAAVIDAHAGVPGAGVAEPNTLVMVMGTSSCHMLNHREEKLVPGVAGVVEGGILPGYFGYETGQAAVGDAFDWMRRTLGHKRFDELDEKAASLPPGSDGVLCLDYLNGARTPLMDGSLAGGFTGLTLAHYPEHLYRALLEATGFGLRWIVDLLEEGGVPVKKLVATGGLPHANPLLMQIYADIMGKQVSVPAARQGPALGAAILGVLAAGRKVSGFGSASTAIRAMAGVDANHDRQPRIYKPDKRSHRAYQATYARYRAWAEDQKFRL